MAEVPPKYVIVGASAAGMAAAQAILAADPSGDVTLFSEERDPPYFRPMIPYLVSGKKRQEEMLLQGSGPYQHTRMSLALNEKAHGLDPLRKVIFLANGREQRYGRLLIATGSRPYLPPEIAGLDTPGVFALRTLADARAMVKRAGMTKKACLLGGGLLNLKAAFALLEKKVEVTLVVYSPEILSQLMEPGDAELIRAALERAGLKIRTGVGVTAILANQNGVCGIHMSDGGQLPCEMVCVGKGVRPNVEWVAVSGVSVDKGVVVNHHTLTNIEDVYAAGDVAVTYDPITGYPVVTGLWTNSVEMGRCAGLNMAGRETVYGGTLGILNATQVADTPFVSMGIVHTSGTKFEVHKERKRDSLTKFVFSEDGKRMIGVVLVGNIDRAGLYRNLIRDQKNILAIKTDILQQRLHYGHFLRL